MKNEYPELNQQHKDGFVSHDKLGAKYNMNYLLNKVVDFEIQTNRKKGELGLLSDKKTTQLKAIIGIMAVTGCRVSEALALKFDDFIFEEDVGDKLWLTVTLKNLKGNKKVTNYNQKFSIKRVPIVIDSNQVFYKPFVKPIVDWIKQLIEWQEMGIFTTTDFLVFENWTRWMVYYYTYKYLNINPHGFRKIFTTYLVVDKEYPIKVVQKIIGHRDLKNLEFYVNLKTDDIKRAVLDRTDLINPKKRSDKK